MEDNTDGYVTALSYPIQHEPDLNPHIQALAVTQAGYSPPATEDGFRVLELGCGAGYSLLAHAGANPGGNFVGVDINPVHTDFLEGLAREAGLINIKAICRAFSQLTAEEIGACDFINLHGVWSWVSEENRTRLRSLIDTLLKPGGILYLSYNCLPGMAAIEPLRTLMMLAPAGGETLESRITAAVAFARATGQAGAKFFSDNPSAKKRVDEIAGQEAGYLAHEYFNRDWTAFYHRDIAQSFAASGLTYAGSARLAGNMDQALFAPEARALLDGVAGGENRETLKDYFNNRTFRADLFVRAAAPPAVPSLAGQRFAYVGRPGTLPADAPPHYRAVAQALADQPMTIQELDRSPRLRELDIGGSASNIVFFLAALNIVEPALPLHGEAQRQAATRRLNKAITARALNGEILPGLVSPVTGSVFALRPEEMRIAASLIQGRRIDGPAGEVKTEEHIRAAIPAFVQDLAPLFHYLKIID